MRLLLVGGGAHARTFYIPNLARLAAEAELNALVELEAGVTAVEAVLRANNLSTEVITVEPFTNEMPEAAERRLDRLVDEWQIDAVIVATHPLAHVAYTRWAVRKGLPVLLDKPISTRVGAVSDAAAAKGIEVDFRLLADELAAARSRGRICVSVCAHRRWHPAFDLVLDRIREASTLTGCPVTAIDSHHSDGQWRLPYELMALRGHSYQDGSGKASHSGHHFFDAVWRFMKAGSASGKQSDAMRVYASFVQPRGYLRQMRRDDYLRLFGPDYEAASPLPDDVLDSEFGGYGEMDLASVVTFTDQGVPVALANLDLLHNGWSRRSWLRSGQDLYKGNGRVKHESHRIHVGPFLAVHIHSYQSKDKHDRSDASDLILGGNNHFEVVVFSNSGILDNRPALERFSSEHWVQDESRLLIDEVKSGAIREFIRFVKREIEESQLRSPLEDHLVPTQMLSGVYRSHVASLLGENPVIEYALSAAALGASR